MIGQVFAYFSRLAAAFGGGWTRFWFTPADVRPLCAMRVAAGALAVYLHATLLPDMVDFFSADGLLPAADIAPLEGGTFSYLNFLTTSGELWAVQLLGLVALLLFTLGCWTRLTSLLALVVFLSDVQRAPMITGLTEPILAMQLLYLCLAPCGAHYSLDRWRRNRGGQSPPPDRLSVSANLAMRLIQIHLALWVATMGFSKLGGDTWWIGEGMWWLMARQDSRLVDFTWLHAAPKLVQFWTHVVVLFELGFPILVWIPLARPLLLAAGLVVWTSLALVTGDIPFSLAMLSASLAFVSPDVCAACFRSMDGPVDRR